MPVPGGSDRKGEQSGSNLNKDDRPGKALKLRLGSTVWETIHGPAQSVA